MSATEHGFATQGVPQVACESQELTDAIRCYEDDRMELAIPLFLKLAEHNCEEALLYLHLIYRDGDGVEKDELRARRYKNAYVQRIEQLAATGDSTFQLKLGYILEYGDGVEKDYARAMSIFSKLGDQGVAEAQFHLSRIYAHGWCGQARNILLAARWLDAATRSKWPEALYLSALSILRDTEATSDERANARDLLKESSALGCWQAREYLESKSSAI